MLQVKTHRRFAPNKLDRRAVTNAPMKKDMSETNVTA
jgi:hypothetical protein